jgi:hypothetical protein
MAGTSMPDVAAMTFGVMGIAAFVGWIEEGKVRQAIGATLFLGLAMLTRCHLAALLPVAGILALPRRGFQRRVAEKRLLLLLAPLFLALLLAGGVLLPMYLTSPVIGNKLSPLSRFIDDFSPSLVLANGVAFSTHWVLAIPLALPWLVIYWRQLWRLAFAGMVLGCALIRPTTPSGFCKTSMLALGIVVLSDVVIRAYKQNDITRIFLTAWLFVALPTILYMHHPVKYDIAAAPAVAVLVSGAMGAARKGRQAMASGLALGGGIALGLCVVSADAVLAGLGRSAAAEMIAPAVRRGERVWFAGHWGYQWYAQQAGALPLTRQPLTARAGDLVVLDTADECTVLSAYPRRHLVLRKSYTEPGGRVMDRHAGAGFFDNSFGYLPWAWGTTEIARFEMWRIDRGAEDLVSQVKDDVR